MEKTLHLDTMKSAVKRGTWSVVGIVVAYIAIATFRLSVTSPYSYDEDQFFAGPSEVARYGLHPYRDFPYFHMPNLVYAYAPLFLFSHYPFLLARLLSGFFAIGVSIAVFLVSRSLLPQDDKRISLSVALSAAVLVANSSLYALAASRVWNHAPSTLCALIAFMAHSHALRGCRSGKYFLLSGIFLGMAIGIRLSFAPLVLPFLIMPILLPNSDAKWKVRGIVAFGAGGLLANALGLYFWITHPAQFWFGNVHYASLNTLYKAEMGYVTAMWIRDKLVYLAQLVFSHPADLLIIFATMFCFLGAKVRHIGRSILTHRDFLFLVILLPFLYTGSFAPTPAWPQYFFAPLPFLVLLGPYALAYLRDGEARLACVRSLALAAVLSCFFGSFPKTSGAVRPLVEPETWVPIQVHAAASELAAEVSKVGKGGMVLTLVPTFAAEAGIPVYPPLVVGVFGWRVSHLLPPSERHHQSMAGPADLQDLLQSKRPVVAFKHHSVPQSLEEPLREFVRRYRYRCKELSHGLEVWIPLS